MLSPLRLCPERRRVCPHNPFSQLARFLCLVLLSNRSWLLDDVMCVRVDDLSQHGVSLNRLSRVLVHLGVLVSLVGIPAPGDSLTSAAMVG